MSVRATIYTANVGISSELARRLQLHHNLLQLSIVLAELLNGEANIELGEPCCIVVRGISRSLMIMIIISRHI